MIKPALDEAQVVVDALFGTDCHAILKASMMF